MNPTTGFSESAGPGSAFATTQWTRVLAARGSTPEAGAALTQLCETYYAPVIAFLRCAGNDEDRARDMAHDFFARLLERGGFEHLDRGRARFRSYLLGALKHYLADACDRNRAIRRGGGHEHVPIEPATDTSPGCDPVDARRRTAEEEFDRQWAVALLDRALARVGQEYESPERKAQFEALKPWLTGDVQGLSQAGVAAQLRMNEGAVKVAIHRLRRRVRDVVKAEIAETVSDPAQVQDELRSLIVALN